MRIVNDSFSSRPNAQSIAGTCHSRRDFLRGSALAAAGVGLFPFINSGKSGVEQPMTRSFGRLDFNVTTLGLGGQASIQWTPEDVDPVAIITKAYHSGVNYFDTSNVYGPSQLNFGKAFRQLGLVPGLPNYRESRRRSIFLATKTGLRWTKGGDDAICRRGFTRGAADSHAMDDVRRSLSQIFGDDAGHYPEGAYLDLVLIHSLTSREEINGLYTGLDKTDPSMEHIGALAGLRDLRDGTNLTGLNPREEKLIRHIGFSGHHSAPVMMEMVRRDTDNLLDGVLVAINANDRLYTNMQYNLFPVLQARNIGVIAMKVFADGAMYEKEARFSRTPEDVIRSVGSSDLPSRPLIEYSLTVPGVDTAIIGIGQTSDNPRQCQLAQNLSAAQVSPESLSETDRRQVEAMTHPLKDGGTNYFQIANEGLSPPADLRLKVVKGASPTVSLFWDTAIAGNEPINHYEIQRDGKALKQIAFLPQVSMKPFSWQDDSPGAIDGRYRVFAVDKIGRRAESEELRAG